MEKGFILSCFRTLVLTPKRSGLSVFFSVLSSLIPSLKVVLGVFIGMVFTLALQVNAFSDVHPQDWFAPHVERFRSMGVLEGDGVTGDFVPNRQANRAEIATIFSKYDALMRADFALQLQTMKQEILKEIELDLTNKSSGVSSDLVQQMENKLATERSNWSNELRRLEQKTYTIETSVKNFNLAEKTVVAVDTNSTESVTVPTVSVVKKFDLPLPENTIGTMKLVKQGIPNKCPSRWKQTDFMTQLLGGYLFYERTCVTDQMCQVEYFQGTADAIAVCAEGSRQADYLYLGQNDSAENLYRRVCYTCPE